MTDKPLNGNALVWIVVSNLIVAAIVGSVAYYGTSSRIDGDVSARLASIESRAANIEEDIKEVRAELRTAQAAEDKADNARLEARVNFLEAQLRGLLEERRLNQ